jgi:hypothetical protein
MLRKLVAVSLVLALFVVCGCATMHTRAMEWKKITSYDLVYAAKDVEWVLGLDIPSSCHWDPYWEGIGQAR